MRVIAPAFNYKSISNTWKFPNIKFDICNNPFSKMPPIKQNSMMRVVHKLHLFIAQSHFKRKFNSSAFQKLQQKPLNNLWTISLYKCLHDKFGCCVPNEHYYNECLLIICSAACGFFILEEKKLSIVFHFNAPCFRKIKKTVKQVNILTSCLWAVKNFVLRKRRANEFVCFFDVY